MLWDHFQSVLDGEDIQEDSGCRESDCPLIKESIDDCSAMQGAVLFSEKGIDGGMHNSLENRGDLVVEEAGTGFGQHSNIDPYNENTNLGILTPLDIFAPSAETDTSIDSRSMGSLTEEGILSYKTEKEAPIGEKHYPVRVDGRIIGDLHDAEESCVNLGKGNEAEVIISQKRKQADIEIARAILGYGQKWYKHIDKVWKERNLSEVVSFGILKQRLRTKRFQKLLSCAQQDMSILDDIEKGLFLVDDLFNESNSDISVICSRELAYGSDEESLGSLEDSVISSDDNINNIDDSFSDFEEMNLREQAQPVVWETEEEQLLVQGVLQFGNNWTKIRSEYGLQMFSIQSLREHAMSQRVSNDLKAARLHRKRVEEYAATEEKELAWMEMNKAHQKKSDESLYGESQCCSKSKNNSIGMATANLLKMMPSIRYRVHKVEEEVWVSLFVLPASDVLENPLL